VSSQPRSTSGAPIVDEGVTVFLAARRQDELERVAKRLGNNAVPIATDITRQEDLDRLFETIRERVGHLDIVVPNAGEAVFAKIGDYTHELMDQTFDLNLKGTVFTVQGALPLMSEGGSIVLMSSINATRAATMVGIYGATKAALQSFARTWADELKDRRIRVNSISPGVILTPAYTRSGITLAATEELNIERIPLGRLGTPEDVGRAVAFLAGDDSSWINATDLVIDGGQEGVA
jgi:NAD(P)-dependent dehydrogenase (short-subunit alcohol dehydrogenase family)